MPRRKPAKEILRGFLYKKGQAIGGGVDTVTGPWHNRHGIDVICGYGGIGRRAGFRFLCREACGFDPHYPYHKNRCGKNGAAAVFLYKKIPSKQKWCSKFVLVHKII
jgi:hypothetical protein